MEVLVHMNAFDIRHQALFTLLRRGCSIQLNLSISTSSQIPYNRIANNYLSYRNELLYLCDRLLVCTTATRHNNLIVLNAIRNNDIQRLIIWSTCYICVRTINCCALFPNVMQVLSGCLNRQRCCLANCLTNMHKTFCNCRTCVRGHCYDIRGSLVIGVTIYMVQRNYIVVTVSYRSISSRGCQNGLSVILCVPLIRDRTAIRYCTGTIQSYIRIAGTDVTVGQCIECRSLALRSNEL